MRLLNAASIGTRKKETPSYENSGVDSMIESTDAYPDFREPYDQNQITAASGSMNGRLKRIAQPNNLTIHG